MWSAKDLKLDERLLGSGVTSAYPLPCSGNPLKVEMGDVVTLKKGDVKILVRVTSRQEDECEGNILGFEPPQVPPQLSCLKLNDTIQFTEKYVFEIAKENQ